MRIMPRPLQLLGFLLFLFAMSTQATPPPPSPAATRGPQTVDWTDLMPEEDLRLLMSMPMVDHENMTDEELTEGLNAGSLRPQGSNNGKSPLEEGSAIESSLEAEVANAIGLAMSGKATTGERSWRDALVSTRVRPEFDNKPIRIAGYIVPQEYDDNMVIRSFFLVPYFGACIHVPPPPPNQIIYVRYPKGLTLENLYTPFWVSGTLKVETVENEMALASYAMDAQRLEEYQEDALLD